MGTSFLLRSVDRREHPIFKTGALNHSAALPTQANQSLGGEKIKNSLATGPELDPNANSPSRNRPPAPKFFTVFCRFRYVVFHKVFPFNLLDMHLIEMTGAEFLLLCFRSVFGAAAALFFVSKAFAQPALRERDRIFCERWAALGIGTILIIGCSILMRFVEGEQTVVIVARLFARAVRWLLF